MHNFQGETSQSAAGPSPSEKPMRGMYQLLLIGCLCARKTLKLEYLTKQDKVVCKVGRGAPKHAKEKFWRVIVAATIKRSFNYHGQCNLSLYFPLKGKTTF